MMKKNILASLFKGLGVFYIAVSGGGGCNVFTDMSNKTSDQAIIDDANNLIDHSLFNDAILKLKTLSPAGQTLRNVQDLYASAYAGRGRLDLLNLSLTLSGSGNPPTIFLTLLKAFKGSSVLNYNDQISAEGYMLGISNTASGRTADENMFMIFVELAKLGTLFAFTADPLGIGSVDASFTTSCALSQAQADQVATAISNILDSMTTLGTNALSNSLPAGFASCAGALSLLCGMNTVAQVSNSAEQLAKTLVGENVQHIGLEITATNGLCELVPGGPCPGNTFGMGQGLVSWCGFP